MNIAKLRLIFIIIACLCGLIIVNFKPALFKWIPFFYAFAFDLINKLENYKR